MTIQPAVPLSVSTAGNALIETLKSLIRDDLAESFFGSLNFSEVQPIADYFLAIEEDEVAAMAIRQWIHADDDWMEHAEEALPYLLLHPDTEDRPGGIRYWDGGDRALIDAWEASR